MQGASVLRVHDVKETKEMITVYKALGGTTYFLEWIMKNDLEFGTDGIRGLFLKKEFLRSLRSNLE